MVDSEVEAAGGARIDLILQFLKDLTYQNFFKIVFSTLWWYSVPFIGGFTKMNSFHIYATYREEMRALNQTVNDIYVAQMDA
eukprot:CAMPEP_0168621486 /NCGR_PEP_ID=MMETSP0449_2-20121227/7719_1 /TAXON_ID=1082188 /ORGANISM="Strombidium rassoulzadegani, Strain ras09" /LENGTH=81 /DNA_ID=CAMNT_0008662607 /DNA_START=37 /DNA_END=279 /DNA_ORIENTATION=-